MPTPRPIIVPRMGATVPMVNDSMRMFTIMVDMATAMTAVMIGTDIEATEPRAMSRMITAMSRPIWSECSEIPDSAGLPLSVTGPPKVTSNPALTAGSVAAFRAWNIVLASSALVMVVEYDTEE